MASSGDSAAKTAHATGPRPHWPAAEPTRSAKIGHKVQVKVPPSLMLYCLLSMAILRLTCDSQAHSLNPTTNVGRHRQAARAERSLGATLSARRDRLGESLADDNTEPDRAPASNSAQLVSQLAELVRVATQRPIRRRADEKSEMAELDDETRLAHDEELEAAELGAPASPDTRGLDTTDLMVLDGDGQSSNVTCSPDYDDQALIVASGNLTAEQQQQVLAGADQSGLLAPGQSGNLSEEQQSQLLKQRQSQLQHQNHCFSSGSKMIEFITRVITPILFSIIIVVGLVGNIMVMLVILEDRKTERELTPTNLLILDLSLADLSFIIFCIPFTGWDYAVGHWVFGSLWCKFNQYLIVVCALSSIYTLVLMSIDRFLAIVYPIECMSYRTSKNMLYAIYIKWVLILLSASPTVAMHGLVDSPLGPDQFNCRFLSDSYNPLQFQIIFFITSYLFPLILILCLYLSLIIKLWFGTKPHGHKESSKMLESKKKVTWLVAGIVILFALCWCPIQVMLILMRLKSHKITATYITIQVCSHILGYVNSCVNPIVYAFASETFLNSFKRSSFGRFCYNHLCFCLLRRPNNDTANFLNQHDNTQVHHLHHHRHSSSQPDQHDRAAISRAFQQHVTSLPADYADNANITTTTTSTNINNNTTPLLNHSTRHHNHQVGASHVASNQQAGLGSSSESEANVRSANLVATPHYGTTDKIEPDAIATKTCCYKNGDGVSKIGSLPLEQRDRHQAGQLPLTLLPNLDPDALSSSKTAAGHTNPEQKQTSRSPSVNKTQTFERALDCRPPPTLKQQLVARVDCSGNSQVSHRCEPCYQ